MRERQLNLFGFDSNKKSPSKSNNILLPLDTLILLGVVIILLLTIAFSLGVEKGRRTLKAKKEEVAVEADLPKQPVVVAKTESKPKVEAVEVVAPVTQKKEVATASKPSGTSYVIRLATYTKENRDLAVKEMEKLKRQGYPAGLSESGKYLILMVGEFTDRVETDKKLAILKKTYKDCYIKKVR